mgnify:FL=1
MGFKVSGLYNIIQSFDIVPGNRRGRPYQATWRTDRGDSRPRGSSPWTWSVNNDRTVRNGSDGPSIVTSSALALPVDFSGNFSGELSTSVGGEMGWDLGPAVTANASVGAAAGAALDWRIRQDLGARLNEQVNLIASR